MTYHPQDPVRLRKIAAALPLSQIWRAALAETWVRLLPGAGHRHAAPPPLHWRRRAVDHQTEYLGG